MSVLSDCSAERTVFSAFWRTTSRFCGIASSCMSWSTIEAVSRPLARPLMLLVGM